MRLMLVNSDLGCGGAERVLALLANAWVRCGKQVMLLTISSDPPFYALDPAVEYRGLGLASKSGNTAIALLANLDRVKGLRAVVREWSPDVVISFTVHTNIRTLIATAGLRVPTVVCEHTDPEQLRLAPVWRSLRRVTYPKAEVVTCLTPNALEWLAPMLRGKGYVLPNPVVVPDAKAALKPALPGNRRVVAMGRLHPAKGFDVLLRAFANLADKHRDWDLLILGDGPLRAELETLIAELGLTRRAHLLGRLQDPFSVLRASDLFVLSSSREGFPVSLCEAMACGLPAISFDCPSGPAYIIREGIDGLLVANGDLDALSAAMERLMSNADERKAMAARGPEVAQRFSLSRFLSTWDEILQHATTAHPT
jgi:GalNAc-alpha-(1->4)-GalNAc-alpha-(1->3)-diNAcBac-PP-undecaprenol alpha-1,4-N-acetyl-D-galactosaminyltransferase